jgi:hypothetical protein
MLYQIYLTKLDIFIGFQNPWHWFQAEYIQLKTDISDVSDLSDLQSGSRALALAPSRIYPTYIRYIRRNQN